MINDCYLQVFQDFTNNKKKINSAVFFSCRPLHNILRFTITDETFPHSGKQDCFKQILQSLANMYGSSIQDV